MDTPELLESASLMVSEKVVVREYLAHDEWEVALDLLAELGDVHLPPPAFWRSLADAAEQMRLHRTAARCHRRGREARDGVARAGDVRRP